jgi:tetratricopeptide (TPR) repeat protein
MKLCFKYNTAMTQITLTALLLVMSLTAYTQDSFLEKGDSSLKNEQYDKAEQTFRAAIKSDIANLIYQSQLGLTLIKEKKYNEAEQVLTKVIKSDDKNLAAIWYSGIGNFYNGQDRAAINRFEKALTLLDKKSDRVYSANWFIGKCYANLLKTEGLTHAETDRMFECYEKYLELQPNAEDAQTIKEYLEQKKKSRPSRSVKIWIDHE